MTEVPKFALEDIADQYSRVLILGSLPGQKSLDLQAYYAHPQNQFWRMLSAVYQEQAPLKFDERKLYLLRHRLALWDVLHSADRDGSLNSAIRNPVPNNIVSFLKRYPAVSAIAINGTTAGKLFEKHIAPELSAAGLVVTTAVLPSTSPAATRAFDEKLAEWRAFLQAAGT